MEKVLSNYRFNQTCAIKQSLNQFYKLGVKLFYTSNWLLNKQERQFLLKVSKKCTTTSYKYR